jgi:hypothetical protein
VVERTMRRAQAGVRGLCEVVSVGMRAVNPSEWVLYTKEPFLESAKASSNVLLIEFKLELRTNLKGERQDAILGRRWVLQKTARILHREDALCWDLPPIKSWSSFVDSHSIRRCRIVCELHCEVLLEETADDGDT